MRCVESAHAGHAMTALSLAPALPEMVAVSEIYQGAALQREIPIIVFNGELDRIRSGYYPPLFYPKMGKLAKDFIPLFEQAIYIHNFKGAGGGEAPTEGRLACPFLRRNRAPGGRVPISRPPVSAVSQARSSGPTLATGRCSSGMPAARGWCTPRRRCPP